MPALDELISIPRVARLLEMDRSTLSRKVRQGRFPATVVGGIYVTTLRDVLAAEASGRARGKRGPKARPFPARIQKLVDGGTETIPDA